MLAPRRACAYTAQSPSVTTVSHLSRAGCRLTPIPARARRAHDGMHGSARNPLSPVCSRAGGGAGELAGPTGPRAPRRGTTGNTSALPPDAGWPELRPQHRLAHRDGVGRRRAAPRRPAARRLAQGHAPARPSADGARAPRRIDERSGGVTTAQARDVESLSWVGSLSGTGPRREEAVRRLHELLVRGARTEVARRAGSDAGTRD